MTKPGSWKILMFLSSYPWKSVLFVVVVVFSFVFNLLWVWGVFWLWWAYSCVRIGEVVFLETVQRRKYPKLFWSVIATWTLMGIYYLVSGFYPELKEYLS